MRIQHGYSPRMRKARSIWKSLLGCVRAALLGPWLGALGCLNEQPVHWSPQQSRRIELAVSAEQAPPSTQLWLREAHAQLADLLPEQEAGALLTEQLIRTDGKPVDVCAHFGLDPRRLHTVLHNYSGLKYTAQGAGEEDGANMPAPPWNGFDDVWIEMPDGTKLSARLGFATDASGVRDADCIVVLPGFFGDNTVKRTRALAEYLLAAGFHVLALEMRGHGQTEATQPEVAYTFGVRETDDLMHLADWLQAKPHVLRTGLIGFCWSANVALLSAWYEGRPDGDRNITPTIARVLTARPDRVRFAAGIMAFSPIVQWEGLVDILQKDYGFLEHPVYATLQKTNRARMEQKHYARISGSLRDLIEFEYARCGVVLPDGTAEGYRFLRLAPYAGRPLAPKLTCARVPVLIVHAANDPLAPAQDVADLIVREPNPRVAAVMLAGGGHVGFANYVPRYYYSLITSFFDPAAGAAGSMPADGFTIARDAAFPAAEN